MKGGGCSGGLISLSLRDVFSSILQRMDDKWLLRVSYLEIYQEKVRDLLNPAADDLKVRVSRTRGVYVEPREEVVRSVEETLQLLEEGERHRHYGQTRMNDLSSRSHTIFRLCIEHKPQPSQQAQQTAAAAAAVAAASASLPTSYAPPPSRRREKVRVSVLNFVDLAGSERQSQSGSSGLRQQEGSFINKSLLNLGIVISRLADGRERGEKGAEPVPFRDSKLTHILSGSLGGNSRIVIVCSISPALCNSEHSLSTLRFGSRCARVRQTVRVNEVSGDEAEINRYEGKIRQLQNRLSVLPCSAAHQPQQQQQLLTTGEEKEEESVRAERRLLAEDRLKVEEERLQLEQELTAFKALIMTATNAGLVAGPAAGRRRRATFGDGRQSGGGKDAAEGGGAGGGGAAGAAALSESQHEYYRSEQTQRVVAALEAKVDGLELLLKELSTENSSLMRDNEDMAGDAERVTARLEELQQEGRAKEEQLQREARTRRQWEAGEGVEELPEAELQAMRVALEAVMRKVDRQLLWREFCRARGEEGGEQEATRMERERTLRAELATMKERKEKEDAEQQQRERAAEQRLSALTADRQQLQSAQQQSQERIGSLELSLRRSQERTAALDAEKAELQRQWEELAADSRRVREENAEYSRKLLDVIRPAAGMPQQAKLSGSREMTGLEAFSLPPAMLYTQQQPASPALQPALPAGMMSVHVPLSASLSLDELMTSAASPLLQHERAAASAAFHPLQDMTAQAINAASPSRPPTPVLSRSPSPFLLSASKPAASGSARKPPPTGLAARRK